jgi:ABC-type multidrug transport system ATPase subunit
VLLFWSEPTTGLDSSTALSTIGVLKQVARAGRTVVLSLHTPSAKLFALLDRLILVAYGRIVFAGPAREAVAYFGGLGFPAPMHANPAEFCRTDPPPLACCFRDH